MSQINSVQDNREYYEYKIKSGDTFSMIMFRMFGYVPTDSRYKITQDYLLSLNPQIKNPNKIKAGDMLRLGVLPPVKQTTQRDVSTPVKPPLQENFITNQVHPKDADDFWLLSWLANNSNYLTIPGGIATGATVNFASPANIALMTQINNYYADYKNGKITKGQYDHLRKISLDKLKTNIGPFEKFLFGQQTTHEAIRIARGGGVPSGANIAKHADKLNKLAAVGKVGGYALVGVGLTASCMQIANTQDKQEKNEIFVETVTSTSIGLAGGALIGLFLISNPIGWGAALVLASGSVALSYASGKAAKKLYDVYGNEVDFVSGTGVNRICR